MYLLPSLVKLKCDRRLTFQRAMWTILVVLYMTLLEKTEFVRRSISQQQSIVCESPDQKSSCQFSSPQASEWIFLRMPASEAVFIWRGAVKNFTDWG